MGLKGRKRRLKNFKQRAFDFVGDEAFGIGYRRIIRDRKEMQVGTGKHKRLISKISKHMSNVIPRIRKIEEELLSKKSATESYEIVRAHANTDFAVQEYFNRPSISELLEFFKMKKLKLKKSSYLTQETGLMCKSFANRHKGITIEKLEKASAELRNDIKSTSFTGIVNSGNVIVLGQNRDGKIRLAIIDL